MIEFATLFGLGFLTASLLALILAPAIHRRIVAYTEKRLFATMPISPAEVRAQKDMARALYAAENAKLKQELEDERQRSVALRIRHDNEAVQLKAQDEAKTLLTQQVTVLEGEVKQLQGELAEKEKTNTELSSKLQISQEVAEKRATEIKTLTAKVQQIARDLDDVKLTLASRNIELEQERVRVLSIKTEKDTLSKELIHADARNKEAANQITRESRKVTNLELRLAEKIAQDADNETLLERRAAEIARLKQRLRAAATHVTGKASGSLEDDHAYGPSNNVSQHVEPATEHSLQNDHDMTNDLQNLGDECRKLSAQLMALKDNTQDGELREELAKLAAKMVALTAKAEGPASPIYQLLADTNETADDTSLAARTKKQLDLANA